ncbi:MAG: Vibrio phage pYD38-A [Pseudomonadota bacterium]|jgi:hypothetical protein
MTNEQTIDAIMEKADDFAQATAYSYPNVERTELRGMISAAITAKDAEIALLRLRLNPEWIEWGGGLCPIENGISFSARLRNGEVINCRYADEHRWSHGGGCIDDPDCDIVAYLVLPWPPQDMNCQQRPRPAAKEQKQ